MRAEQPLAAPIARHVWETRYRAGAPAELSVAATWRRVAHALAQVEPADRDVWEGRFLEILQDFRFLPGGRIQAGAGTHRQATLFNCFVMGIIEDSIPGIFQALREGAVTMQQGGGVGYDFSTLRPRGARARAAGSIASGPVSFMDVWDAMCATIQSTGARRGAMMATLRCDHPDIAEFIDAKRAPGRLRHFNLSVQVTDALMHAVARDEEWKLVFPAAALDEDGDSVVREWPGHAAAVGCRILRRVRARELWHSLLRASYDTGEPGVLFIDRINRLNNLAYCERISATNPCGEVPLPPYGACDLGAINLTRLIRDPFTPQARLDTQRVADIAATAVRLLDNVIDASIFPLPQQRQAVLRARRIGLGITGLADALVMLGLRYGSEAALAFAETTMRAICHAAYRQSVAIAREKGSFPAFARAAYLQSPFIEALPADIRDDIARDGIRNSHLLSIAPTGTISLLAGNVSSGIEPVFAPDHRRMVLNAQGAAGCVRGDRLCRAAVAGAAGPDGRRAGRNGDGGRSADRGASGHAGRAAGACGQCDLQDDPCPGGDPVRGLRRRL
ncbi:adenosylcobalamin-dependent ribonucleoside-diphosphate reductase [Limobrevibacterium gyesilva]|uniref:Vitamin B12-dependent ribonucleotide reductase n=1 Tax=Limobrevibacterium gyesilva TaxID=2991712 RepID=A0AA41YKW5_9PROT|nr:adenosylcobalamin-dependent ribonucleoside-diphosphate reductase [Limobrevibacterium gyesilva]MCW3475254.1 adenosylcobalamin-dependent ribonucleoside-diphosphate reductase [Limobrevibacterium gyesilva]